MTSSEPTKCPVCHDHLYLGRCLRCQSLPAPGTAVLASVGTYGLVADVVYVDCKDGKITLAWPNQVTLSYPADLVNFV